MVTGAADVAAADPAAVPVIACRLCGSTELRSFLDLGATPPCELFLTAAAVNWLQGNQARSVYGRGEKVVYPFSAVS